LYLSQYLWDAALTYGWLPEHLVQAALQHAQDDFDPPDPDAPHQYLSMAALAIAFVLGFRAYRWALSGHMSGDLTPKEFALSWVVLLCALAGLLASLAVSATGWIVPTSGILRISAYALIGFVGWRIYPWLERKARSP
jgi:hypothetical protein